MKHRAVRKKRKDAVTRTIIISKDLHDRIKHVADRAEASWNAALVWLLNTHHDLQRSEAREPEDR